MNLTIANSKIAIPYAQAFYDFSVRRNIIHQITADFKNLSSLLIQQPNLKKYLINPIIKNYSKKKVIENIFKDILNPETLKFLYLLISKNRINLLEPIIENYLNFVFEAASIKKLEIYTAVAFNKFQRSCLIKKLKQLTQAREIQLIMIVDATLIGGFLIKTKSKILDFTIKNQFKKLAKYLNSTLEF